jgi:hypothetical protein
MELTLGTHTYDVKICNLAGFCFVSSSKLRVNDSARRAESQVTISFEEDTLFCNYATLKSAKNEKNNYVENILATLL